MLNSQVIVSSREVEHPARSNPNQAQGAASKRLADGIIVLVCGYFCGLSLPLGENFVIACKLELGRISRWRGRVDLANSHVLAVAGD